MSNTRISAVSALLLAAVLLAGCQTNKEVAGPPLLNGNWASSDGVYTAEFRNGSFRAVANDTGGVISEGSYVALSDSNVKLSWSGIVSGRSNSAECLKPNPDQLDCVDQNGNKFSLKRART